MNTVRRLNLSESSWFKLATHFSIFLSDKDTKELNNVQSLAEDWKNSLESIRFAVNENESSLGQNLRQIISLLESFKKTLEKGSL